MSRTKQRETGAIWKLLFETTETIKNFYSRKYVKKPKKDLTMSQLRVISCIFFNESGVMRIKDISSELGITAGGISQTVDSLVQEGLLTRCKDETDRRAVSVSLSEYGCQVRSQVNRIFAEMFSRFLRGVSAEKLAAFGEVLKTIQQNLKRENENEK